MGDWRREHFDDMETKMKVGENGQRVRMLELLRAARGVFSHGEACTNAGRAVQNHSDTLRRGVRASFVSSTDGLREVHRGTRQARKPQTLFEIFSELCAKRPR